MNSGRVAVGAIAMSDLPRPKERAAASCDTPVASSPKQPSSFMVANRSTARRQPGVPANVISPFRRRSPARGSSAKTVDAASAKTAQRPMAEPCWAPRANAAVPVPLVSRQIASTSPNVLGTRSPRFSKVSGSWNTPMDVESTGSA